MADVETVAYFRDKFVPFEEANLSIASAAVLYGLSIYTVFPAFWNGQEHKLYAFRLQDHFKRLQNSAKIMAFDDFIKQWDYQQFLAAMKGLLKQNHVRQDSLVRVGVFVDDSLKGTRMHGLKHSLSAFVYSTPPLLPKSGTHLGVSSWQRTPDNSIPSRAKINGSYVNAALMKHEAEQNGFDDAIALDAHGHVTESTVANLFLVRGGQLLTADNSSDLLEGITRDTVFKLAEDLGISYQQTTIDRSELYLAEEMFLCGSSVQITPVTAVDHRAIGTGKPGAVTKKIQKAYESAGRGMNEDLSGWLTAIT